MQDAETARGTVVVDRMNRPIPSVNVHSSSHCRTEVEDEVQVEIESEGESKRRRRGCQLIPHRTTLRAGTREYRDWPARPNCGSGRSVVHHRPFVHSSIHPSIPLSLLLRSLVPFPFSLCCLLPYLSWDLAGPRLFTLFFPPSPSVRFYDPSGSVYMTGALSHLRRRLCLPYL